MFRIRNINYAEAIFCKRSRSISCGAKNFPCYASNSKDDFEKLMQPFERKEPWKEIQIMAKEKHGHLNSTSVNEVRRIAHKLQYRPRINMTSWKKHRTHSLIHTVKEERNSNKNASPPHMFFTDNSRSLKSKNKYRKQDEDEDYDSYERDEMGRYILKKEDRNEEKIKMRTEDMFTNKTDAVSSAKMFGRRKAGMKLKNLTKHDNFNKGDISGDRFYNNNTNAVYNQNNNDTYNQNNNDAYNQNNNDAYNQNNNDTYNRNNNDTYNQNNNVITSRLPTEKRHGAYYNEFMKLIEKQEESPFIFTPFEGRLSREIDLLLEKLTRELNEARSFSGLGINAHLVKLLSSNKILKPTRVQIDSIPVLMQGRSTIIESSTGSGKTLAFLLPMIENLSQYPCSNLIIVPTRELATQIYKEAIKYGVNKNIISRHVSGVEEGHDKKLIHALKDSKILIGTPKRLLEIVDSNGNHFRQVRRIIIDEVDKLLPVKSSTTKKSNYVNKHSGVNKTKPTEKLLAMLTYYNRRNMQLVATSATISDNLVKELVDMGFGHRPAMIKLIPDGYKHGRIPENIKHLFTVVQEDDESSSFRLIGRLFKRSREKSTLVFIPGGFSVEKVVDEFKEIGFVAKALYKELLLPAPTAYENFMTNFKEGDVEIVVSTEETVRGIDFPFLNEIYLTFVPDSPEKYVHLAGRVGRLGKPARVTTIIGTSDAKAKLKRRFSVLGVKGVMMKLSK